METQAFTAISVAGIGSVVILLSILVLVKARRSRGLRAGRQSVRWLKQAQPVLTKDERVLGFARQIWIQAPVQRDLAVVTNRRLIFFKPRFFGRMTFDDFLWQDVDDVQVTTQMFSATLTVEGLKHRNGECGTVSRRMRGIEKMPAQRVYALAQEIEEEWREKNRVRKMEEERAKSGNMLIHLPGNGHTPADSTVEDHLAQLKRFHEGGLITGAEYEAQKAKLISRIGRVQSEPW
jgi:hypothetical protein